MDLGFMCLSPCGHNRMPPKMFSQVMTVFVVNYVLIVTQIYVSVARVI